MWSGSPRSESHHGWVRALSQVTGFSLYPHMAEGTRALWSLSYQAWVDLWNLPAPTYHSWSLLTSSQLLHQLIWWNCVVTLTRLIQTRSYTYLLSDNFNIWMNLQKFISKYLSYHSITSSLPSPLWLSSNFKIDFWNARGRSNGVLEGCVRMHFQEFILELKIVFHFFGLQQGETL